MVKASRALAERRTVGVAIAESSSPVQTLGEHGTAAGKVRWISENAFWVNDQTNQAQDPYYKVGVSIDAMNFVNVPENFRLVPGMTRLRTSRSAAGRSGSTCWTASSRG